MESYEEKIEKSVKILEEANYILIGAGAGLSTAAGLHYAGEDIKMDFKDFMEKYFFQDLYSASFCEYDTEEEKWAFWAKMIKRNRYNERPLALYEQLLKLAGTKEYFVITTNVDAQFEKAGFEKEKIFAMQGDYGYLQCKYACHAKLYDNEEMVKNWLREIKKGRIPSYLVPKCPVCGRKMEVNLRKDEFFVQDENWYQQAKRYQRFIEKTIHKKIVLLEMGVGFNTPGIIRFPFERITYQNLEATLIRINKEYPLSDIKIRNQTISFEEDINSVIKSFIKELKG